MITVFLSSAGATNAINVIKALEKSSRDYRIIGGDMSPDSAGLSMVDKPYILPPANHPGFINRVINICIDEKVDVALPIYSADFPVFGANLYAFEKQGIKTYAPPAAALAITSDKYKVCEFLKSIGITAPRTWLFEELCGPVPLPLFRKLRHGSGSKSIETITTREALKVFADPDFIYQEYIPGQEYTIDVLSDLQGRMIVASPRTRDKVYGGLSVIGTTIEDEEIVEETRLIVEKLKLPGPSNVQCKRTPDGDLYFYDINPRFASGGLPLAVAAGVNIPELLIEILLGEPIPEEIKPIPGVKMIRFWDAITVNSK